VRKFMKLFKSLLIAPATLGLLAPMSVSANELNLTEVSGYSSSEEVQNISEFYPKELAVTNSRVDGLEARLNNIEAGSFSETTTAAFTSNFYIGSTDDDDATADDVVMATYDFQIDLNTSFTGEDSFDVSIDAGNSAVEGVAEFDGNGSGDGLIVDGIAYTFPLTEKTTVKVGDGTDASDLFTTACAYGGPSDTLSSCGNVNAGVGNAGAFVGAAYDFGSGFTLAVGYDGPNNSVMTAEGLDAYGANLNYVADSWGSSITYGIVETDIGGMNDVTETEDTFIALNAYYTPDGSLPSISVGYETGEIGGASPDTNETESFFIGLTWAEVGPGSAGVALGHSTTVEKEAAEYMYEAYYEYPVNDSMTITPLVFRQEVSDDAFEDTTGAMLKTTFTF